MKNFYFLLLFVMPLLSQAQMPGDNLTAFNGDGLIPTSSRTAREWVREEDKINGRIPHSKLVKMQSAAEAMVAFLHDSCFSEIDFSPIWHGEYSTSTFGIQARSEDGRGRLSIMSNDLTPLLRYLTINGKDVAGIRPPAGTQDNNRYFESEDDNHVRTITWLVTAGHDKLPYIEVTRKEYLQEARAELTQIKNAIIADITSKTPIRSAAIQEAEKKASLDQLNDNYSGSDLQVRLRLFTKNYQTDEAYLKGSIENATAALDKTIRLMDSISSHSIAAELNKPAMVSVEAANFHGFEDNETDRNMLIRMNPAYYTINSSNEKPQLFLVSWSYDPTGPVGSDMDRAIRENIDFSQLKGLVNR